MALEKMTYQAQRAYVTLMLQVVGAGLAAAADHDDTVRRELSALPDGFIMQMTVFPIGPTFTLRVGRGGSAAVVHDFTGRADLVIRFKHISHAFQVFSFQEGTARAFANDRMVVDGSVAYAMIFVRCLNSLQQLILPRVIAKNVIKRYDPQLGLGEKLRKATGIYRDVATTLVKGL